MQYLVDHATPMSCKCSAGRRPRQAAASHKRHPIAGSPRARAVSRPLPRMEFNATARLFSNSTRVARAPVRIPPDWGACVPDSTLGRAVLQRRRFNVVVWVQPSRQNGFGRNAGLTQAFSTASASSQASWLVGETPQRAAGAVEVIRATGQVLRLLEVWQDREPNPSLRVRWRAIYRSRRGCRGL